MSNNMTEIKKMIESGALFVCSHSGGKDSQAMYNYLKTIIPAGQLVVVHAHLDGVEWAGVVEHIKGTIDPMVEYFQVSAGKTFFQMVEARGMWPSAQHRQCTSDLKNAPIYKLINKLANERGFKIVVNCIGIRAAESAARAKKEPLKINKKLTGKGTKKTVYDWMPIFTWTTEDVFGFIRKNGQEPHWAYAKGMSRLSCCFCILASKSDMRIAAEINPEMLEKVAALEIKIGHTMKYEKGAQVGIKQFLGVA
jgi:DNA sulfur modification protein DndC